MARSIGWSVARSIGWSVVLLAPLTASAQDRPDLTGTWVASPDAAAASSTAKPTPPVWGDEFSIDHKGANFTVSRRFAAGQATLAYVLDGTETRMRLPGRLCEPDSGATWTAAWDGRNIAIAMIGVVPANGKPIKTDVRSTLKPEAADTLTIELTQRVASQAAPRVTSTTYKRKSSTITSNAPTAQRVNASMADVAWISGVWTGGSGMMTLEERWTPPAGGSMIGVSRTIRDGLMSGFEFLCIVERNGGLVYQAMPNGRQPATDFTLTRIDADNAVFENPAHDFPKMIRYTRKPDGSLEAVISGEGGAKPVTYSFKKQ